MPVPDFPKAGELYYVPAIIPQWHCCVDVDAIGDPITKIPEEDLQTSGVLGQCYLFVLDAKAHADVLSTYEEDEDRPGSLRTFDLMLVLAPHAATQKMKKVLLVFSVDDWHNYMKKVEIDD